MKSLVVPVRAPGGLGQTFLFRLRRCHQDQRACRRKLVAKVKNSTPQRLRDGSVCGFFLPFLGTAFNVSSEDTHAVVQWRLRLGPRELCSVHSVNRGRELGILHANFPCRRPHDLVWHIPVYRCELRLQGLFVQPSTRIQRHDGR